ncbi:MAG: hypothetical protein ACTTJJ_06445 [Prevotella fusca]|uniref:hypothetical protein n=1 Tax=Prevotella fusca TaxID=589436 RepID=UPI003FA0D48A
MARLTTCQLVHSSTLSTRNLVNPSTSEEDVIKCKRRLRPVEKILRQGRERR